MSREPQVDASALRAILATTLGLETFQHLAETPQTLFAELGKLALFTASIRIQADRLPRTKLRTAVIQADAEVRRTL